MNNILYSACLVSICTALLYSNPEYVIPFSKLGIQHESTKLTNELKNYPLVVIKFSKEGCPPCKQAAPIFASLAKKYFGKVRFIEIDIRQAGVLLNLYGITAVPTILLFHQGKLIRSLLGVDPLERELPALLNARLK